MSKRFLFLLATAIMAGSALGQTYARYGIQLRSRLALADMPNNPSAGAGIVGYVSPSGREYAIMGVRNGTVFVDVTNPNAPNVLAHIPQPSSTWHENAVLGHHAYLSTDSNGNGVQIVDMSLIDMGVVTLVATYTGNGLTNVHTVQANEASNTVFLNGSNRGLVFLDATNPAAPVEVGRWQGRYVHDSHIENYTSGPYAGKEILFACTGSTGLYILDITNKAAPAQLASNRYIPTGGYCHSGVLTADKKYFLVNDEFDENNGIVNNCTTHIFNVENLEDPIYIGTFENPINAVDHNSRLIDGKLFLAAYRQGLRVYDANDPENMTEIGFFDSYPGTNNFSYSGAWGTYVFPSGNAVIADMQRGLFVVDVTESQDLGAPVLSLQTIEGNLQAGTEAVLRKADNSILQFESAVTPLGSQVVGVVAYETTRLPAQTISIRHAARILGIAQANLSVEVKHWASGEWHGKGSSEINGTNSVVNLSPFSASGYVSSTGRIEVRFKVATVARYTARRMLVDLDMLKVTVN